MANPSPVLTGLLHRVNPCILAGFVGITAPCLPARIIVCSVPETNPRANIIPGMVFDGAVSQRSLHTDSSLFGYLAMHELTAAYVYAWTAIRTKNSSEFV